MEDYQLSQDQIASLKALHRTLRDKRLAYRVNAVILLGSGWSPSQVAEALLVDEKSIRNWFVRHDEGGEERLILLDTVAAKRANWSWQGLANLAECAFYP